jgi:hypothetical protein
MWGIGLLLVIGLYILLVKLISIILPGKAKVIFVALSVLVPVSTPFWFLLSPGYAHFRSLCAQQDRLQIIKTVAVDIIWDDRSCFMSMKTLDKHAYKGITCRNRATNSTFKRGKNWNESQCRVSCLDQPYVNYGVQKICVENCLEEFSESLESFTYLEYDYESNWTEVISGRLTETERTITTQQYEIMARTLNYRYSPYGTGWATILGASSGTAPSFSCSEKVKFNIYEIFPPKG